MKGGGFGLRSGNVRLNRESNAMGGSVTTLRQIGRWMYRILTLVAKVTHKPKTGRLSVELQ